MQNEATWSDAGFSEVRGGIYWKIPPGEYWDCTGGKWHHDIAREKAVDAHAKHMSDLSEEMELRKLTIVELKDINQLAYRSWLQRQQSYYGVTFYSSSPDSETCRQEASANVKLVAQLSFWEHSESDLPLKLMMEYTKGIDTCTEAFGQAYAVVNKRILAWFREKEQQ